MLQKYTLKLLLFYLFSCIIWIYFSEVLVDKITPVNYHGDILEVIEGVSLVIISVYFFYLLIKKQQKEIHASEAQYRNLFYSHPSPMWIYDIETLMFQEVNNAAIVYYGFSRNEFLTMNILQIRPPEERQRLMDSIKRLPEKFYKSGYWKHLKKNGEVFTVSISSHRITFNNRECDLVMAVDITKQLYYEESLKTSYLAEKNLKEELERNILLANRSLRETKRLADVLEKVNNIIIITDTRGLIKWVNPAFSKHTGYSPEEVTGKETNILHGPDTDPSTQAAINESIRTGEFKTFEILNYTKDGQAYWTDLNISPIYNDQGELEEYISIQANITERKEREKQIRDQNDALRRLGWMNSHSLRKPLASIISLAELGAQAATLEEIKEYQVLIKQCSEELDITVKEIGKQINQGEASL